eukprot:jgi/Chrzof1/14314/Cz08g32200.t1
MHGRESVFLVAGSVWVQSCADTSRSAWRGEADRQTYKTVSELTVNLQSTSGQLTRLLNLQSSYSQLTVSLTVTGNALLLMLSELHVFPNKHIPRL